MASIDRLEARQRFGAALRAWREALGFDQADVAQEMGVNRSTVTQWEAGLADLRHEQHYRLARFLRIDWADYCREIGLEPYEGLALSDWWGWAYAQKVARRMNRPRHTSPALNGHGTARGVDTSRRSRDQGDIARYSVAPAH